MVCHPRAASAPGFAAHGGGGPGCDRASWTTRADVNLMNCVIAVASERADVKRISCFSGCRHPTRATSQAPGVEVRHAAPGVATPPKLLHVCAEHGDQILQVRLGGHREPAKRQARLVDVLTPDDDGES